MKMNDASEFLSAMISEQFSALTTGEEGLLNRQKLSQFSLDTFKQIISDENLQCGDEDIAFQAVVDYIEGR